MVTGVRARNHEHTPRCVEGGPERSGHGPATGVCGALPAIVKEIRGRCRGQVVVLAQAHPLSTPCRGLLANCEVGPADGDQCRARLRTSLVGGAFQRLRPEELPGPGRSPAVGGATLLPRGCERHGAYMRSTT